MKIYHLVSLDLKAQVTKFYIKVLILDPGHGTIIVTCGKLSTVRTCTIIPYTETQFERLTVSAD